MQKALMMLLRWLSMVLKYVWFYKIKKVKKFRQMTKNIDYLQKSLLQDAKKSLDFLIGFQNITG